MWYQTNTNKQWHFWLPKQKRYLCYHSDTTTLGKPTKNLMSKEQRNNACEICKEALTQIALTAIDNSFKQSAPKPSRIIKVIKRG